ncbi:LysR family transcriptional regulator [Massilia agilis]|uniref:LysR family transcriptional regulator n=1 Tax=Massilia agilis TaxID=1811226 RepID=A0ABT2DFJ7_9BURK|nr:LysR family transcriptional regulator [Massilia agilis]MCS0810102.1 LysR family transcriptional regulator [Massilia agilis]
MNFQTFDLNLLRIFDAVMTEQNITRAAERLSTTQPAVSNALKRLREAANDDILVRTARGMKPTPRAEELWPTVRAALASLENVLAPEHFDISTAKASLRIAMADSTANLLLPQLMERIRKQAPGIDIRMIPLPGRDPRPMLLNADADLAVGSFPGIVAQLREGQQRDVTLHHLRLYSGEPMCIMRKGHPLADQELTIDRYCEALHLLVSFSGSPSGPADDVLATLGKSRRIALTVNQFSTAFHMVACSDLIAVVPHHLIEASNFADQLEVKVLPFQLPIVYVDMLWHERDMRHPVHKWVRETVTRIPAVSEHD